MIKGRSLVVLLAASMRGLSRFLERVSALAPFFSSCLTSSAYPSTTAIPNGVRPVSGSYASRMPGLLRTYSLSLAPTRFPVFAS